MIRSVKGLQRCSLYTQQHEHCFALNENKVGNQLKYIRVHGRNLLYVKWTTDCATDFTNGYPSDRP